jgi:hypothetical protein
MGKEGEPMSEAMNIYGEIRSIDELRSLYQQLRDEAQAVEDRLQLTEIKERSEYLCTLADEPVWRDEFDRGGVEALELCVREDHSLARLLNERARLLNVPGDAYRPWREGEDSNATRNV